MVTIKDIAREAGVSISTVSKVINGSATISQNTIDNVQSIISQLGYVPNSSAQNLAKRCTNTVAFAAKISRDTAFTNPHIFEILSGADKKLATKQYSTLLMALGGNSSLVIQQLLAKQKIDGLIVHASALNKDSARVLEEYNIPTVVIGLPDFDVKLCWIDNDNDISGRMAVQHLINVGKKNIVYLGGENYDIISESRYNGAQKQIEEHNQKVALVRKKGQSTPEDGYHMTSRLLKGGMVDGIICSNNAIALGCMNCLRDKGINIPHDVAVISFDDYPFARFMLPPLTVVNIDMYNLGQQAASLLLQSINNPALPITTLTTSPVLIVRESTQAK